MTEIVSEEIVSSKRAIHNLKKFCQDPFFEENDPDLMKSVNLIYQNLLVSSYEISCPNSSTNQEGENEQNLEGDAQTNEEAE